MTTIMDVLDILDKAYRDPDHPSWARVLAGADISNFGFYPGHQMRIDWIATIDYLTGENSYERPFEGFILRDGLQEWQFWYSVRQHEWNASPYRSA